MKNCNEDSAVGCFLEVDVQYLCNTIADNSTRLSLLLKSILSLSTSEV